MVGERFTISLEPGAEFKGSNPGNSVPENVEETVLDSTTESDPEYKQIGAWSVIRTDDEMRDMVARMLEKNAQDVQISDIFQLTVEYNNRQAFNSRVDALNLADRYSDDQVKLQKYTQKLEQLAKLLY